MSHTKQRQKLQTAQRRLQEARALRDQRVHESAASGMSTREIGRTVGLSHQRIAQIINQKMGD